LLPPPPPHIWAWSHPACIFGALSTVFRHGKVIHHAELYQSRLLQALLRWMKGDFIMLLPNNIVNRENHNLNTYRNENRNTINLLLTKYKIRTKRESYRFARETASRICYLCFCRGIVYIRKLKVLTSRHPKVRETFRRLTLTSWGNSRTRAVWHKFHAFKIGAYATPIGSTQKQQQPLLLLAVRCLEAMLVQMPELDCSESNGANSAEQN
jgi:hypothetical protein